jgi:hypothetical protein
MGSSQVLPTPLSGGGGSAYTPTVDGLFGDGMDGDAVLSVLTTLGRETYYNNLTITGTGTLKPAGFRCFVKGTLTIDAGGSFNDDGNSSIGNAAPLPTAGLGARGTLNAVGGVGTAGNGGGGNGGTGGGNTNSSPNGVNALPAGGTGGGIPAGNTGGPAGTVTAPVQGQRWHGTAWQQQGRFNNGGAQLQFNGGGGGGSGASSALGTLGGGSGSGAGLVWVAAKNVINNGRISANGGNGGNASGVANGGGGGGGGGGSVLLATLSQSTGTVQALGGVGGSGVGTGLAGLNGVTGSVQVVVLA